MVSRGLHGSSLWRELRGLRDPKYNQCKGFVIEQVSATDGPRYEFQIVTPGLDGWGPLAVDAEGRPLVMPWTRVRVKATSIAVCGAPSPGAVARAMNTPEGAPPPSQIKVRVPNGKVPGDKFTVHTEWGWATAEVPVGTLPGTKIVVQLPRTAYEASKLAATETLDGPGPTK